MAISRYMYSPSSQAKLSCVETLKPDNMEGLRNGFWLTASADTINLAMQLRVSYSISNYLGTAVVGGKSFACGAGISRSGDTSEGTDALQRSKVTY